jgi:hypothetical protein
LGHVFAQKQYGTIMMYLKSLAATFLTAAAFLATVALTAASGSAAAAFSPLLFMVAVAGSLVSAAGRTSLASGGLSGASLPLK